MTDPLIRAADQLRLCLKVMTTAAEHEERSAPDPRGERPEIIADCRTALKVYDKLRDQTPEDEPSARLLDESRLGGGSGVPSPAVPFQPFDGRAMGT